MFTKKVENEAYFDEAMTQVSFFSDQALNQVSPVFLRSRQ
jgi:hypothetical protein